MTTPAQASGHQNFVTDVPVQGPTDEGIRAASCHFAATLPARPPCVERPLPPVFLGGVEIDLTRFA